MPQIVNKEIILEIQKISNILKISPENKIFLSKMLKKYEMETEIYVEKNIDKTLDNINEDLNKIEFTGKELKQIIATHKFNQYNVSLLNLFKEIGEYSFEIQSKKENNKLIDSIDIFTIIYIAKYLEEVSENCLLEDGSGLFYENNEYSSIFDLKEENNLNPFFNFLHKGNIEVQTEALIENQKIDNLFFID
jgi:hypothetical protein